MKFEVEKLEKSIGGVKYVWYNAYWVDEDGDKHLIKLGLGSVAEAREQISIWVSEKQKFSRTIVETFEIDV